MSRESPLPYFSLLGISEDASQEEIETRYQELADYLASPAIPASLQDWARTQSTLVDEAYAVLADPERRAAARLGQAPPAAEATPPESRERPPSAAQPAARRPEPRGSGVSELPRPLLFGAPVVVAIVVALVIGLYGLPGGDGDGAADEQTNALLDTDRVAELQVAQQQDPNNPEVLSELGEIFFQADEWQLSIGWFTKLLAVDPNNVHAQTDLGTANFNLGLYAGAKDAWLGALDIDPDDVQAHYNLGFYYATVEPVDMDAARSEWQRVVELMPDSTLGQTAQQHLDSLPEETTPEASPAP